MCVVIVELSLQCSCMIANGSHHPIRKNITYLILYNNGRYYMTASLCCSNYQGTQQLYSWNELCSHDGPNSAGISLVTIYMCIQTCSYEDNQFILAVLGSLRHAYIYILCDLGT